MKHKGTKTLESKRLILRRFSIEDAQAVYDNWACDTEVTKYLMWPAHENTEVTRGILNDWISSYKEEDFYTWAIVLKEHGSEPVGSISVVQKNENTGMVHIGYCIGKDWWNQGITSEALHLLIDFFFQEVKVNRIESRHDPRNPGSGRVMMKCGMKYEGTLRKADWNNQGICDASYYAMLSEEYYERYKK